MIETSDMQFDSRMVTAEETPEDHDVEVTLRPQTLTEYIGQDKVKENMAIYIQATLWITSCCMGRRGLERQHFPPSLRMKWVSTCG